ncbi:MAG TPA: type 4a pilus biogenesis protein PilO [Pseudomonadales bacterium]
MAASDFFRELKESTRDVDINNLDWQNPGVFPLIVKVVLWCAAAILVAAAGIYYFLMPMQEELQDVQNKELELKEVFEDKAAKAANLEAYKKQMVEMEALFKALVSQLPADTEVPGLLEDISQLGEKSGLKIDSISLQPEKVKEIFIELPIDLKLTGTYHDFGAFVSGVSSMPRIVTLHDFTIATVAQSSELNIAVLAKTYRFRKQDEE